MSLLLFSLRSEKPGLARFSAVGDLGHATASVMCTSSTPEPPVSMLAIGQRDDMGGLFPDGASYVQPGTVKVGRDWAPLVTSWSPYQSLIHSGRNSSYCTGTFPIHLG